MALYRTKHHKGRHSKQTRYKVRRIKRRNASKGSVRRRVAKALKKYVRGNPPRVKGRKTKGGRAVTLRNFTGTIVKKSDGTVQIVGRGRKK